MKVGDTVLHVNGTSPDVIKVLIEALSADSFVVSNGCWTYHGWGQIFDNFLDADEAILQNIDYQIGNLQNQIKTLLESRATVLLRRISW